MAYGIAGEVIVITGASSGIGAATALELARRGARLALAARRVDELTGVAEAVNAAGSEALIIPTDVTDPRQVTRLAQRVIEHYGRVDALINNAGIGASLPLAKSDPNDIQRVFNVNLLGSVLATRAFLPGMLERRHGAVISVASVAGLIAVDPLYSATKFGLRGFSLSLRRQLRGSGVSVSLVSPGFIRTPLTATMRGRLPGPDVVAHAIAGLLQHPRREVIVPRYYRVAVLAERLAPWLVDRASAGR